MGLVVMLARNGMRCTTTPGHWEIPEGYRMDKPDGHVRKLTSMEPHEERTITYILPTIAWASLLPIIARDAPPGARIEVHTADMQELTEQTLLKLDRPDMEVRLIPRRSGK
jgi:hypothetical protein